MNTCDTGGQLPFEGSAEIADIVSRLIKEHGIQTFIETGTQRGATALWAAKQGVDVITIEADKEYYEEAFENLKGSRVQILFGDSGEAIRNRIFMPVHGRILFFLDAHGCKIGGTPLLRELEAIRDTCRTSPIITIHDVQVPDHPELGYDKYEDCELSTDFVRKCLEATGFGERNIGYNSVPDGASRGFCYVT